MPVTVILNARHSNTALSGKSVTSDPEFEENGDRENKVFPIQVSHGVLFLFLSIVIIIDNYKNIVL